MTFLKYVSHPIVGSHLRLFASATNGQKNGKNLASVNNNNNNDKNNTNNGAPVKKTTQIESAKATPQNSLNKQQSPRKNVQSTSNFNAKIDESTTKNLISKIRMENAQKKPNVIGKTSEQIVNVTIFRFVQHFNRFFFVEIFGFHLHHL